MGRIRTTKPEFYLHEGLYDLEKETGLPCRLAYQGLWTQCDREGRFRWRPRPLKQHILPYDDLDFADVLDALWIGGFIECYESDGEVFGYVPTFPEHQYVNAREKESLLPDPAQCVHKERPQKDLQQTDASLTRASREADAPLSSVQRPVIQRPESRRPRRSKKSPVVLVLPWVKYPAIDTPEMRAAWGRWESHRSAKRKPISQQAADEQFAMLAEIGVARALIAIRHSIAGDYQGIFEPRAGPEKSGMTKEERIAETNRKFAERKAQEA